MAAKKTRAKSASSAQDDFYTRLRDRVAGWSERKAINPKYRDYVLALPDLFHLVVKLMMDPRVDKTSKAVLGAAIAWAVSPIDLLPDFLGPIGMVDDLLVLALALDYMLDRTPRAVVSEHWAGTGDVFGIIRNVLDRADEWVGRGLVTRIRALMASKTSERAGNGVKATPPPRRKAAPAARAKKAPAAKKAAPAKKAPARKAPAKPKAAARKPRTA